MSPDEPMSAGARLKRADESVAQRFTRLMRATSSRWGLLTDPPFVCVLEAVLLVGSVLLYNVGAIGRAELPIVYVLLALPVVVAVAVDMALRRARDRVVRWLASLPFPVENMNALLNGVAQNLLIRFEKRPPARAELNAELEKIHPDCFALEYNDDEPELEVRIGVLDSKLNPASANHRRYARVRAMVEHALVPLSKEHPIELVRIS